MEGTLEQLKRFGRTVDDIKQSHANFLLERARKLTLDLSESGIELPRGADNIDEPFANLVAKVSKRRMQTQEVQAKFGEAFKRLAIMRPNEVDRAKVAGLTDSQCKQALLLACKMLDSAATLHVLETGVAQAYNEICNHSVDQLVRMEEKAIACVSKIAKLWNKESDSFLRQISKKEDEHQKRTAELARLARRAEKAAKDRYALRMELENLKTRLPKDDEEVTELRRQLSQSDADLSALRASNRELFEKVTNLEEGRKRVSRTVSI